MSRNLRDAGQSRGTRILGRVQAPRMPDKVKTLPGILPCFSKIFSFKLDFSGGNVGIVSQLPHLPFHIDGIGKLGKGPHLYLV